ncbi:MAG: hypothetical protein JNM40_00140 [Myxococcales bacterium]|nr:hypothetical protein [Myxococcales bacterium]
MRTALSLCGVLESLLALSPAWAVPPGFPAPPPMAPPPPPMAPPPMAPPPMAPPPRRTVPSASPSASAATPSQPATGTPRPPVPSGPPCDGTRLGSLCFSPPSQKLLTFAELDDYCASQKKKVPGLSEYRHAMPYAPPGLFPPGQSIWMSDAWQYNRNLHEMGSVVVYYGPGRWNSGPVSADARLPVACVDRLLAERESSKLHYVGLSKEKITALSQNTTQRDPMWCWAAVAQMILTLRGRQMPQADIVQAMMGEQASGISSTDLAKRIQEVGISAVEDKHVGKQGTTFQTATDGGKNWKTMDGYNPLGATGSADNIDSRQLATELFDGDVYILAYGAGADRAHAVLLVGVDVTVSPSDFAVIDRFQLLRYTHKVAIKRYHIINPWPGKGYQTVSPDELQELVKWKVSMSRQP